MDEKFVTISLVGIDESILGSFKIPLLTTEFMLLRAYDQNWYVYLSEYSRHSCVDESTMKKIAYISGLKQLPVLNMISITREAPIGSVLLPFRYWPEAKILMERVEFLCVKSNLHE